MLSANADYPQDASRLLDLCRQSIIFDSLAGVAECLGVIAQDSSVRIVQVTAQPISETLSLCPQHYAHDVGIVAVYPPLAS